MKKNIVQVSPVVRSRSGPHRPRLQDWLPTLPVGGGTLEVGPTGGNSDHSRIPERNVELSSLSFLPVPYEVGRFLHQILPISVQDHRTKPSCHSLKLLQL